MVKISTTTTTTIRKEAKLDGATLRALLDLPRKAKLVIRLTEEEDWTGSIIDLDSHKLEVSWEHTDVESNEPVIEGATAAIPKESTFVKDWS